ncbi:MAG TPA: hypothetical protein VGQ57_20215 [Polyangiaceae bacterium]|jgi:hypothetical protein|nr:hypothetical protein [Polyangiaceae bacterium]
MGSRLEERKLPGAYPNLKVVHADADHVVAMWHRSVIEVWRGVATVEGSERMIATCERMLAEVGTPVTFIAVLERSSPPPSEHVRKALARWSRDLVPRMASAVLVAEGGGFRAALVRGVGTALTLLMPHRVPFKFCTSIDEGLKVLAPSLVRSPGGVLGLSAAVEHARQLGV